MRRMAKTHRPARNHHIHRNARLGSRRSAIMTLGITAPACCCRASARASSRSHRSSLRGALRRSISRCFTSAGSRGGRTRRCWPRCASSRRRLSKRREASRPGSSTTRGFKKKGSHSVGVARQYCGRPGKTDNCQIAVTLSIANHHMGPPVAYRLYLPEEWAKDRPPAEALPHGTPLAKRLGKSRHGAPERTVHNTASMKSRLSAPDRPGSPSLPGNSGAIRSHWASFSSRRIKAGLRFSSLESDLCVCENPLRPAVSRSVAPYRMSTGPSTTLTE
jgi:hypothetical protein